jgi:hypothetical protein
VSPASGTGNGTVTVNVAAQPVAEQRAATVTFTAGTLIKTIAVAQAGAPAALDVEPSTITAAYTAGTYSVAVTSNTTWTAAVSAGATWCAVSPASGTGNGTLTVNVTEENPLAEPRAATVTIAAGTLDKQVAVAQAAYPFYAASTQTWTIGEQTWSDAIQMPACNKENFTDSYTEPHCRSYTSGTNTWYYYNWPYVNQNAAQLCPAPWRVPSRSDYIELANAGTLLADIWPLSGYVNGSSTYNVGSGGGVRSSTEDGDNAYYLNYVSSGQRVSNAGKHFGFQVRCVK